MDVPRRRIWMASEKIFCLLRFRPSRRMLIATNKNLEGEQMSILESASARRDVADRETYDVVVVGAGFGGMYMLYRLRGLGLSVRVYEQGDGVGGTWYWNRYPGARCDVESMQYSYSFSDELQQEWNWPEKFSGHADIRAYADHVADRFGLRAHIDFETEVCAAHYDEGLRLW